MRYRGCGSDDHFAGSPLCKNNAPRPRFGKQRNITEAVHFLQEASSCLSSLALDQTGESPYHRTDGDEEPRDAQQHSEPEAERHETNYLLPIEAEVAVNHISSHMDGGMEDQESPSGFR